MGSTCDVRRTPSAMSTLNQLEFVTMDFTHSCVCARVCVRGDAAEQKLEEDGGGGVENE